MRSGAGLRRSVVGALVVAGLVVAACGEGAVVAGPPAGSPSITGTLTSVEPFVPRTENCVEAGDRPPDAAVSTDDEPICTDPDTDLVGSVLVEEHPDRQLDAPGPPPGDKAAVSPPPGDKVAVSPPPGDKVAVSVDTEARVLHAVDGGHVEAAFDDLQVGQLVQVWFAGPVAESYPVQAAAEAVVILQAPAE